MIQAGASWCGPCNILKPMLIDAVKAHDGKLEYLYVDIDENPKIAQLLRVSSILHYQNPSLG
jgi:thioredoxin-like negative regulator of GroEL